MAKKREMFLLLLFFLLVSCSYLIPFCEAQCYKDEARKSLEKLCGAARNIYEDRDVFDGIKRDLHDFSYNIEDKDGFDNFVKRMEELYERYRGRSTGLINELVNCRSLTEVDNVDRYNDSFAFFKEAFKEDLRNFNDELESNGGHIDGKVKDHFNTILKEMVEFYCKDNGKAL
jgi:hypothetical protein